MKVYFEVIQTEFRSTKSFNMEQRRLMHLGFFWLCSLLINFCWCILHSLQGDKTPFLQKFFTEFLLVVENINEEKAVSIKGARTGSFQLLGDVLTRFSDHCTNTVTQTSAVAKAEIQVRLDYIPKARLGQPQILKCKGLN